MKQDKIKKTLGEKLRELTNLGKNAGVDFDEELIHDFRVVVKSLRSFLRLLSMAGDNSQIKIHGKFKQLYHISGSIREAQLELGKLTNKQSAIPAYTDSLHQKIDREKIEWNTHYAKKIFDELRDQLIRQEYNSLSPVVLVSFIDTKMTAIHELCNLKTLTDDQVHTIRKLAKDIIYITKLAREQWSAGFAQIDALQMKPLEQIADIIGGYNDDRIILDHLRSFQSEKMANEEKSTLENLYSEESMRLKKTKKKTLAFVRKYINEEGSVNL